MKLSLRRISILFVIVWVIVASILLFEGASPIVLIGISVMIVEGILCLLLIPKLENKFHFVKALPEEINREDDVLLQGTPFISAILFFYLNILTSVFYVKLILGLTIILGTGTFYVSRAAAKIKSDPHDRFMSIFFLVFLVAGVIYEIIVILFVILIAPRLTIPLIVEVLVISGLTIIIFLPLAFASAYFPIRYGVRSPKWQKNV
jgi:hypothetical protein